jgi:hypothetical protein
MSPWIGKRTLAIVTACLNAAGSPDFALTEVEVTHDEYADGVHCELVEEQLLAAGYEEPFLHFDDGAAARFVVAALRKYLATTTCAPDMITA